MKLEEAQTLKAYRNVSGLGSLSRRTSAPESVSVIRNLSVLANRLMLHSNGR